MALQSTSINYHTLKMVKQQFYFGNIQYKTDENNPKRYLAVFVLGCIVNFDVDVICSFCGLGEETSALLL